MSSTSHKEEYDKEKEKHRDTHNLKKEEKKKR